MGASKKDLRRREQKKAEEAGTRVATTKGGVAVKAPKEQVQCNVCKAMLVKEQKVQLKDHATNKHPKSEFSSCFPGVTV
ncbi:hypothetical protein IE53DRAFT_385434 [Violaceomyces palustris]|uniref:Uncharacterized protein n=1 Tax=Violaceomyces palustris TaxID=1673888 RepID=A0ACD0P2C6_9BASI|nr:hypothetical protein IE53DRAFT_385434 [Violaceomyces palustris]